MRTAFFTTNYTNYTNYPCGDGFTRRMTGGCAKAVGVFYRPEGAKEPSPGQRPGYNTAKVTIALKGQKN